MPSKDELYLLYKNLGTRISEILGGNLWILSSSQYMAYHTNCWTLDIDDGKHNSDEGSGYVFAIRAFSN